MPLLNIQVVIVGADPVGMLIAYNLARFGISCLLTEANLEKSQWPKLDFTNCRTMEIFRMMGIADECRAQHEFSLNSPDQLQSSPTRNNDGTQATEPGQRCSLTVLEAWLRTKCLDEPSIECRSGWKYVYHQETANQVDSSFVDADGNEHTVRSQYFVGADGGSSSVRKNCGIKMHGASLPGAMFLVHFRSKELSSLRPFGRFRNMFSPSPGWIIDQGEPDTFTAHMPLKSPNQDTSKINPFEWVYQIAGGAGDPFRFEIDEIIVTSAWCPDFAIAEHYITPVGKVILAGDACHCAPSHGAYGLNTGVEDALALSWRLSAILKGYGGPHLLPSYESEQRSTMMHRLAHLYEHAQAQAQRPELPLWETHGQSEFIANAVGGEALRTYVKEQLDEAGSEHQERGVELDTRFKSAIIYKPLPSSDILPPPWNPKKYTPSTYPGHRAPHVFLQDGTTSILDYLGPEFTLVSFTSSSDDEHTDCSQQANFFITLAQEMGVAILNSLVVNEDHVRGVWGTNFALVRADGHICWRGDQVPAREETRHVLRVVLGWEVCPGYIETSPGTDLDIFRNEFPGTATS
ncbi:hypothetical protein G7Y89_g13935 [Cudoniella acicularis]|uniref:FAD-binding domain-containing protein n=1 Tax=Cudoniella acicularis TaxID=354080 RepID=A0A8H4VVL1_9HELO|nr:hypothetical protein G7Y89_g13935 [Cudoniella acicularis]